MKISSAGAPKRRKAFFCQNTALTAAAEPEMIRKKAPAVR